MNDYLISSKELVSLSRRFTDKKYRKALMTLNYLHVPVLKRRQDIGYKICVTKQEAYLKLSNLGYRWVIDIQHWSNV